MRRRGGTSHDRHAARPLRRRLTVWFAAPLLLLLAPILPMAAAAPGKTAGQPGGTFELTRTSRSELADVTMRISKLSITVAGRVTLELTVESAPTQDVTWPDVGKALNGLTVASTSRGQPVATAEGRVRRTRRYVLEPFLSGKHTIGALQFTCPRPDATPMTIATEPVTINVASVIGDNASDPKPAGPRGAVPYAPGRGPPWLLIGVGSTLLLGAGLTASVIAVRRANRKRPPAPSLIELARRDIAALQRGAGDDLTTAAFYARLSAALRVAIGEMTGIDAPERTTEEILAELEGTDRLADERATRIRSLLNTFDEIKFTGGGVEGARARHLDEVSLLLDDAAMSTAGGDGEAGG